MASMPRLVAYDAFHLADLLLTQPLLLIAGAEAGSLWHSQAVLAAAASTDKHLHKVQAANHIDLYDKEPYISEVLPELVPFFKKNL